MTSLVGRKKIVFLCSVLSLLLLSLTVLAVEEAAVPVPQQPVEMPSVAGLFFRIIVSLIFILGITYVVMRVLKRQNDLQQRQKSWIRVFDYQGLGTNRGIYLLEILGDVYVLGVSEGQINILKEIDPADDYWNDIKENLERSQLDVLPWGLERILKENLGKLKSSKRSADTDFKKQLDSQLGRSNRLYRQISKGGNDGE